MTCTTGQQWSTSAAQGYHLLAGALFAPVLVLQPRLLALALGVALLVMVAAEIIRLGRVPVLSAHFSGIKPIPALYGSQDYCATAWHRARILVAATKRRTVGAGRTAHSAMLQLCLRTQTLNTVVTTAAGMM